MKSLSQMQYVSVKAWVLVLTSFFLSGCTMNADISPLPGQDSKTSDNTQMKVSFETTSVSLTEGSFGLFVIVASKESNEDITLNLTLDGPSNRFQNLAETLVIPRGSKTASFALQTIDDNVYQIDTNFSLQLSSSNSKITVDLGTTEILLVDNDIPPAISVADVSVNEGAGTATLTLAQDRSSANDSIVTWSTANSTALSGTDYTAKVNQSAVITAGSLTTQITISLSDDSTYEANKTFFVNFTSPINATLNTAQAVVTIVNDDAVPQVQFASTSQTVGETAGTFNIQISLNQSSAVDVSVPWTLSGSAANGGGNDYVVNTTSPLTIPAGQTTANISVTINNDVLNESTESAILTLGAPTNAALGSNTAHTINITDDDTMPTVNFSVASQTVSEGVTTATITINQGAVSGNTTSIPFSLSGDATGGGIDYTVSSSPATIAPGNTSTTITVTIVNDTSVEATESIIVTLGSPTSATLGTTTTHTLSVNDDDLGSFTISGVTGQAPDTIVDNILGKGSLPTVSWSASGNATDYDITIFANDGTTVVCPTLNTGSTSHTFTTAECGGSGLTAGLSYKIQVASKASGFPARNADNALYAFQVNQQPVIAATGPWYVATSGSITLNLSTTSPHLNASDADGDTLSITSVGVPTFGSASNTSSSLTFDPGANTGVATVTITVEDGRTGLTTATVTFHVVTASTWSGGGANANWNTTANWCGAVNATNTGCTNVGPVPAGTTVAYIDATCSSNCSPSLSANTTVGGVNLSSGTITQNAFTFTINTGNWIQSGGTFTGSSNNITIGSSLRVTGGVFHSTSGVLQIGYSAPASSNIDFFKVSGTGTFEHNDGEVYFRITTTSSCGVTVPAKFNVDVPNGFNFKNVRVGNILAGCQGYGRLVMASGQVPVIKGNLILDNTSLFSASSLEGVWELEGNYTQISMQNNDHTRFGTVRMIGSTIQTYSSSGTNFTAPHLIIDKTGGSVSPNTVGTSFAASSFKLLNGSFTAPGSTSTFVISYRGNYGDNDSGDLDSFYVAPANAAFSHNSGTIELSGGFETSCSAYPYSAKYYVTHPATITLNNFVVKNRAVGCGAFPTYTPAVGTKARIASLNFQTSYLGGEWDIAGDITNSNTNAIPSGALFNLVGTGNQTITASVTGAVFPLTRINNNSGGTVSFVGTLNFQRGFEYQAGVLDFGTSDVHTNTNFNPPPATYPFYKLTSRFGINSTTGPTVGDAYTLDYVIVNDTGSVMKYFSSGGDIYVSGNLTASGAPVSGNLSKYVVMTGAGNQSITSTTTLVSGLIPSLKIDKNGGTLTFNQDTTISGNFLYLQGSVVLPTTMSTYLNLNTFTWDSGSLTFTNFTINGAVAGSINGNLYVNGNFTYNHISGTNTLNGGAIHVAGNVTISTSASYYLGGSTEFLLVGNANSTLKGYRSGSANFTINKTSGAGITLAGDFNYVSTSTFSLTGGNLDMAGYNLSLGNAGTFPTINLNGNSITKNAGVLRVNNIVQGQGAMYGGTVNP